MASKTAAKVTGVSQQEAGDSREVTLRPHARIPVGDDRIIEGPGTVVMNRATARLWVHMLEHDEETCAWLDIKFADKPAEPSARDFLLEAERLTAKAQSLLRIEEKPTLSAGRAAR
jgi:hypothetical protein